MLYSNDPKHGDEPKPSNAPKHNIEPKQEHSEPMLVVNGVNMHYWYDELFLQPLIVKYLSSMELTATNTFKGVVCKQSDVPFDIGSAETPLTFSIGEPIVRGATGAGRDSLYDSLRLTIKEVFQWNKQHDAKIKNHSFLCPLNLGYAHWTLLQVTIQVLESKGVYYPAPQIIIKIYDSKSMLGKNNSDIQDQLKKILTPIVPEELRTEFVFEIDMPPVKQQPERDTYSCGALVMHMLRHIITNKGVMESINERKPEYYTLSEILTIRSNHLRILDDIKYNNMQLPTAELDGSGVNKQSNVPVLKQKEIDWDDYPLRKAIYELVVTLDPQDSEYFYALIREVVTAEFINDSYLMQDRYEPTAEYKEYFLKTYEDEFNAEIKNLNEDFEDINNARFYRCITIAQRKCREKVKAWFAKHQEALGTFLTEILTFGAEINFKDNGQDKLMEVWKDLLRCKEKNIPPAKALPKPAVLDEQARTFEHDRSFEYDMCDVADRARLPFKIGFVGQTYASGQPYKGQICCQLGPSLTANYVLYYNGGIYSGATSGKGILIILDKFTGKIIEFINGTFWQGGFSHTTAIPATKSTGNYDLIKEHLKLYSNDLRLPVKREMAEEIKPPRVIQYSKFVDKYNSNGFNLQNSDEDALMDDKTQANPAVKISEEVKPSEEVKLTEEVKPSEEVKLSEETELGAELILSDLRQQLQ